MKIAFEPATKDDLEFAHDVTKGNMEKLVDQHYGGWNSEIFKNGFRQNSDYIILGDEEAIGFLSYSLEEEATLFLRNLQLIKERQGQGIGKSVMAKLEEIALERGCRSLKLAVFPNNPAHRFYLRLDFREVGTLRMLIMMEKDILQQPDSTE